MRIKKGDTVYVRTGASKGKTGRVLWVDTDKNRALVEGINMKKRHTRPTQRSPKGGIVTKEASVHLSNLALWDPAIDAPTRLGTKIIVEDGVKRRVRVGRKSGQEI